VWNLLKKLHAEGKLTPAQDFLCQQRQPAEELYDLSADPDEIHNLAGSTQPADQAALKKLRAVLAEWMAETHDKGVAGAKAGRPPLVKKNQTPE
jgi:arylsulfatase A-like enzyme